MPITLKDALISPECHIRHQDTENNENDENQWKNNENWRHMKLHDANSSLGGHRRHQDNENNENNEN